MPSNDAEPPDILQAPILGGRIGRGRIGRAVGGPVAAVGHGQAWWDPGAMIEPRGFLGTVGPSGADGGWRWHLGLVRQG